VRTVLIFLVCFLPTLAFGAAQVGATHTKISLSGVLGETDVLESIPFNISAEIEASNQPYPENSLSLETINISVGKTKLDFLAIPYKELKNVRLTEINLAYIKNFVGDSLIEVKIPFGEFQSCINHDDESEHYLQRQMIYKFHENGTFLNSRIKQPCTH